MSRERDDAATAAARIIYIGGAARSGSTLLGDVLGAQPGVLNAGELSLFWRDVHRGGVCACGEPIAGCPVWGAALAAVESRLGLGPGTWADLAATRASLARTRAARRVLALVRAGRDAWPDDVTRLVDATEMLLDVACSTTGSSAVVDSSKMPTGLLVDGLGGREVALVHLVRDPRAVVASSRRSRRVARGNAESLPPGAGTAAGTARWVRANLGTALAGRRVPVCVTVTYEDLTADPLGTLRKLAEDLDLEVDPTTLDGGALHLAGPSHAAVGNPVRRAGAVRPLRPDLGWRSELPRTHAWLVRATTAPLDAVLRRS